jgi:hypothetical protein
VCGHFEGKWAAHCNELESALHDSSNSRGTSLCEYVEREAAGETGLICTELLKVVAEVRHRDAPASC